MRLVRARRSYEPGHARPAPATKRRYGALVVVALYATVIGLNEWRIQRHVEAVRERQTTEPVFEPAEPPVATGVTE
jgi:hypothetical protein